MAQGSQRNSSPEELLPSGHMVSSLEVNVATLPELLGMQVAELSGEYSPGLHGLRGWVVLPMNPAGTK